MIKEQTYNLEINEKLDKIFKNISYFSEVEYFINIIKNGFLYQNITKSEADIIIVGDSFPDEIILSLNVKIKYIFGGSRVTAIWGDEILPRDADAVSCSVYGYLSEMNLNNSLVIIPLICDSFKKIALILKAQGIKVCTLYIPPVKNEENFKIWRNEIERCINIIAFHMKRPLTKRSIKKAYSIIKSAREQIRIFKNTIKKSNILIPYSAEMAVIHSFYYADDINLWISNLKKFTNVLEKHSDNAENNKSNILLIGSPVYFPNYKIPLLIEDAGLNIAAHCDCCTMKDYLDIHNVYTEKKIYFDDCSSAYVKDCTMFEKVKFIARENKINGVIYHIIKGQIEYDFEMERYEQYFSEMNIPVFRLETDYNYNDIEQLRIRIEAFSEILEQKRLKRL